MLTQVVDLLVVEAQCRQIIQGLFEAGGDEIRTTLRKPAPEQSEDGGLLKAVLEISGRHRHFVKIGGEPESAFDHRVRSQVRIRDCALLPQDQLSQRNYRIRS